MSIFERQKVVTRMAPSPTGHLHIGTARTALFNYLFAKRHGGVFILRTEDTDKERSKKEFEDEIIEGLDWLGITWDAFYRQSERAAIYRGYLEKAIENGKAYVSKEESKMHPGTEVEVVRLKNPNTTITFMDKIRGEITFDTTELGDFVIARSLDDALYHFTVVVDDHEMEVSHVIRGEDHISNTPRQILIQEAIGAERPVYAHLPLILAPDRSKLSKRHGAVMLSEYRRQGYVRSALVNYLALLGWNPGTDRELYELDELVESFDLSGIQKSGAIFDIEKLKWFNKEHMRTWSDAAYFDYVVERIPERVTSLPEWSEERLRRLIPVIRERTNVGDEITADCMAGEYDFAFAAPKPDPALLKWRNDATPRQTLPRLQKLAELVARIPESLEPEEIKSYIWDYALEAGKGEVLWPLRVALTGRERSPDPFTVIHVIGSAEAYKRIKVACDTILMAE
ncbi:MAG TPA: glutamate--tRNA ligase [Candidatus Paceibacterota bacterium]|nr:glutamate--tRNA ligase [Candidatus Paceibacterota bacterium]